MGWNDFMDDWFRFKNKLKSQRNIETINFPYRPTERKRPLKYEPIISTEMDRKQELIDKRNKLLEQLQTVNDELEIIKKSKQLTFADGVKMLIDESQHHKQFVNKNTIDGDGYTLQIIEAKVCCYTIGDEKTQYSVDKTTHDELINFVKLYYGHKYNEFINITII